MTSEHDPIRVGEYVVVTPRGWALDQRGAPARVSEVTGPDTYIVQYPIRKASGELQSKVVGRGDIRRLADDRWADTHSKFLEA